MPNIVEFRFWMNNYDKPQYETWEKLKELGADVIGDYLLSTREDIIKEQFIGQYDKNNQKVYEGDIVQRTITYQNQLGESISQPILQEVFWTDTLSSFCLKTLNSDSYYTINDTLKDCIVVGNIHQVELIQELQS